MLSNPDIAYPSKKQSPLDTAVREGDLKFRIHSGLERLEHTNTWFNNKFLPRRTAIEDWERNYVYGSSFPQWQTPYSSFVKPLGYRAMNRNPVEASIALGLAGRFFFRSQEGKAVGTAVGALSGFILALFSNTKTYQTGQRFLPKAYKEQAQLDEYTDILNYIKYTRLYSAERRQALRDEGIDPEILARQIETGGYKGQQITNIGPETAAAMQYRQKMRSTLYGADLYGDVMNLSAAIPKQQRAHFLEFLSAPVNERKRILSTMPRLERRVFEARWGMQVEQRPDLVSYLSQHELPPPQWSGWSPNLDMDDVKIKVAQHEGLNLSNMGYYPQQISEANALNLPYPDFNKKTDPQDLVNDLKRMLGIDPNWTYMQQMEHANMAANQRDSYPRNPQMSASSVRALMSANNLSGAVQVIPTNQPGSMVELHMGVNS
jgi:hypothetical protein